MQIHFLDRGTKLNIEVKTISGDLVERFDGLYHDSKGNLQLTVESEELFDFFRQPQPNLKMSISFYREQNMFTFDGRFASLEEKYRQKLVDIAMLTNITMESRRTQKRFEIRMRVNIFSYENRQKGELMGEGETNDVCFDAFSVSANVDLSNAPDQRYMLDFTLFNKHIFSLPFRVLKKGKAPVVSKMDYDFVFLFDFSHHAHEKNRLINIFFKELTR
jgi:hypothetical protein